MALAIHAEELCPAVHPGHSHDEWWAWCKEGVESHHLGCSATGLHVDRDKMWLLNGSYWTTCPHCGKKVKLTMKGAIRAHKSGPRSGRKETQ